ncbi:centrosomal protein of 97 kDa [Alosa alosa]|uniref:centrosomal protein of 97 kDa n=1 Tax=Alosa alosa TaxID=278164 RepID=UPI0020152EE9|nr:centrosomal protein of 97 kDa [Alosa alosa]
MANVTTEKPLSPLSYMQSRKMDGLVVDLSDQGLNKLDSTLFSCADTHTLILDNNNIIKLENLDQGTEIKQLSVASNRLVRMMGVSKLRELRLLNLPNNSIGYIEGLKDLVHLEWLNLAGNNLKVMDELNNCVGLQYLDLSDNNVSVIGDLTKLTNLKALHLNGNTITTLRSVPAFLPPKLTVLSLAENEIKDLNEVSYLGSLHSLEQLSIVGNPCVMASSTLAGSDYRPYVVSWCLKLKVLDGYAVSQKEETTLRVEALGAIGKNRLKAEWMYSQGKGHSYRPGQHDQLVQYLASVCPLTVTTALQSAEDAKLERILNKQRQHQRQLLKSDHRSSSSRAHPVPFNLDQQTHESSERISAQPPSLIYRAEPVVQINSWVGTDPSEAPIFYHGVSPSRGDDSTSLRLEDVQTDEEKLHGSQLSSESFFLPVTSTAHPPMCSVDDGRETEPFTILSKAPSQSHVPAQPARDVKATRVGQKTPTYSLVVSSPMVPHENCSLSVTPGEKHSEVEGNVVCSQANNRNCVKVNGEQCRLAESAPAENGEGKPCSLDAAAVRIQAWWRGHWTRLCHPQAKEVRSEIRLRRMQEHILYLTAELERVHQQQEEERLQRLVQEEAVKCLWKQLQSVVTWQNAVMEQLKCGSALSGSRPCAPFSQSENQAPTQPELHSYVDHQGVPQDSINSKVTVNSPDLVSPVEAAAAARSNSVESSQGNIEEQHFSLEQKEQE